MKSECLFRAIFNEFQSKEELILKREEQNRDYEGAILQINNYVYRTRLAKLTPKKKGYFVAMWEKDKTGTNQAYSYEESPEKLIVSIIDGKKYGQFIFPKNELLKYGVLKSAKQKGKMAIRVYPSWITDLNATAKKTQAWQVVHFIDLSEDLEVEKLKEMYFL